MEKKLKIALFTDTYYPQINGVATSVYLLKKYLEYQGHLVHVFTTTDPKADWEPCVHRTRSIPFVSKRRIGLFFHPHITKLIRSMEFDIVHTHTEFSLGRFGRTMARQQDIPLVHTMHTIYEDYTHFILKSGRLDPLLKRAAKTMSASFCNSSDRVIVPTQKVADMMLSYGVYQNMAVIPTGVELQKFAVSFEEETLLKERARLGILPGDKVLVYIGRISSEKNIGEILNHLRSYLPKKPNVKFLIVGDGPAKAGLEALTQKLHLASKVIFAGEQPWQNIALYYKLGDIFVNASQSETQGLTYIEALASGLPVLAKRDDCLAGVVKDGENGFTYETAREFLSLLDQILDNQKQLSQGALAYVPRFSAERFASDVAKLYHQVLDNRPRIVAS